MKGCVCPFLLWQVSVSKGEEMMGKRKTAAALAGMMVVTMLGGAAVPQQVTASSLLTVDCGDVIREVTHCASGSLYGVTESIPADIDTLVTPLYPNVFTNPARAGSAYQQPSGAAIETAERLTGTTGEVMIRLADICRTGRIHSREWTAG